MLSRCWNLARARACGIDPPRRPASASVATASATQMMERILQHQHLSRTAVTSGGRLYSYEHLCSSSDRISHAISTIVGKASKQAAPPRIGLYAVRHSQTIGDHGYHGITAHATMHACGTPLEQAPGAEYLAGTLAIWRAGGIFVPLATSHPPRELTYVLEDAGISAVSMDRRGFSPYFFHLGSVSAPGPSQ